MNLKKLLVSAMTAGMILSVVSMTSMAATDGWYYNGTGWRYYTEEEGYIHDSWREIDEKTYYFDDWGYMVCNVSNYRIMGNGKGYDFSSSGACLNPEGKDIELKGWVKIGRGNAGDYYNSWYYYDDDGQRLRNEWLNDNGKWYYFDKDGWYYHDCCAPIDGKYYYFKSSGELFTGSGWISSDGNWYYAGSGGNLYHDRWLYSGGKWYYFDSTCIMIADANNFAINGIEYNFDANGACLNPYATASTDKITGWHQLSPNFYTKNVWIYYDSNGELYKEWKKISGQWYRFDDVTGIMAQGGVRVIGKDMYAFKDSGAMITGWSQQTIANEKCWVYSGSNGILYTNKWLKDGNNWYYFDNQGIMVSNVENLDISGKDSDKPELYSFNSKGVCLNPYKSATPSTGWFKQTVVVHGSYETKWYYYDADGNMYSEKWLELNGKKYYFDKNGVMLANTLSSQYIDGKYYDFDKNGVFMNPNGREGSNFS